MERPILFSAPMVRAILDGTKTQTRRVVKTQPVDIDEDGPYTQVLKSVGPISFADRKHAVCPYGAVGDTLWVRETWFSAPGYRAGDEHVAPIGFAADGKPPHPSYSKRPSIFMPRWASRITLEITDVRVERLQDISEEDARAEGLTGWAKGRSWIPDGPPLVKYGIADSDGLPGSGETDAWPWTDWCVSPVAAYAKLWDSINAKRAPWESNPWVWVVSFKQTTPRATEGRDERA